MITSLTTKAKKRVALLGASALVALSFTTITAPAHAAAPQCTPPAAVVSCQGVTSDGAGYVMQVPGNFNGTAFIFSHGYRYNIDIPAAIPLIGGYKVTNTPQPGPILAGNDTSVMKYMLSKGYAIFGSGFARQGWNADSGLATDIELIKTFKTQFPATKHVVAWGESLGGFMTQALAESHPELVDASASLCVETGSIEASLTVAGDFLWGIKTFFDPSIKGGNYSAGAAGYAEALGDLGKVFTVMGKLQKGIGVELATGKPQWPDTAPTTITGGALAAIPARSALLLVGLMAGVPTQSAHFDGTTGPGSVNSSSYTGFALAGSPALAVLENGVQSAALGVLVTYDVEQQAGGAIFDNTKTDYSARLGSDAQVFNAGLSGATATGGLLQYLAAAPRAKADAAAVTKMRALVQHTGKVNVPTIMLNSINDAVAQGGNVEWVAQKYAAQYEAEKAANLKAHKPRGAINFLPVYAVPPAHYTKFDATGLPVTTTPAVNGTGHCNFTLKQYTTVVDLLASAASNGKFAGLGQVKNAVRKMGAVYDPKFHPDLLKFYQDQQG